MSRQLFPNIGAKQFQLQAFSLDLSILRLNHGFLLVLALEVLSPLSVCYLAQRRKNPTSPTLENKQP